MHRGGRSEDAGAGDQQSEDGRREAAVQRGRRGLRQSHGPSALRAQVTARSVMTQSTNVHLLSDKCHTGEDAGRRESNPRGCWAENAHPPTTS